MGDGTLAPMENKKDIIVLGAGIVGLSLAVQLAQKGLKVRVVDKGEAGYGCSYGNAGWMTPCFSMPLPRPGLFFKSIKWLLDPESPFYIKPSFNPLLFKWLLNFTANMNQKKMEDSIEVLTLASVESLRFYEELSKEYPEMNFEKKGLLMVSANEEGFKAAVDEMELMSHHGVEGREMNWGDIQNFEPALKKKLRGGVYFPKEAHAEPLLTVQALKKKFLSLGGEFLGNTEVFGFEMSGGKITQIETTRGNLSADLIVLALGTWSRQMSESLDVSIPILGGKGYSLIVEDYKEKPKTPIMIIEKKIAVTPRHDSLRLAGTLELVDGDLSISKRRVRAILKGSQEYLSLPSEPKIREIWRGLRPCTPDGVPMVGFSKKWSNLFYCTGHQMLGLQSAPGTARLARELIMGEPTFIRSEPFNPHRYE